MIAFGFRASVFPQWQCTCKLLNRVLSWALRTCESRSLIMHLMSSCKHWLLAEFLADKGAEVNGKLKMLWE